MLERRPNSSPADRLRMGLKLQEIEGNPLDAEQVAMFEMFEREGWTPERRRAHMLSRHRALAAE